MARSRQPRPILDLIDARLADVESESRERALAAEATFHLMDRAIMVPRERLRGMPDQPRQAVHDNAALRELAHSIATNGILEPVLAGRDPDNPGYYILIAGHRRVAAAELVANGDVEVPLPDDDTRARAARTRALAAQRAAAKERVATIPTIVLDVDRATAFALALVENLQRSDLSRREVMDAVKRLKDDYKWSVREIARRTGRDFGDLAVLIRIAEDPDVAPLVADEVISATAAGALVERANYRVRGPVLAAIRGGRLRTTGDIERALATERARLAPPRQLIRAARAGDDDQVLDIPHLTITDNDARSAGRGVGESTGAVTGQETMGGAAPSVERPAESAHRTGQVSPTTHGGPQDMTRTVEVAAHTRRVRGADGSDSADEAAIEDLVREVITALPLDRRVGPAAVRKLQDLVDHVTAFVEAQATHQRR